MSISFEGVCLTTVILAPGASEVGLGAAALAPLWGDNALAALTQLSSFHFLCAGIVLERHLLGTGRIEDKA